MNAELLYALRDPAGVPSHPVLFLILGVLTFALHIGAVQVMLGAGVLALRGAFSKDLRWRRLATTMLTTSKIAVSVAIVLGVAPLLFVQVTYDPFWYTSNVLSARWVIGFIAILIAGYSAMYAFYNRNHDFVGHETRSPWLMVISLALLLLVGWIMHALSYQMLFPEQWKEWYAPGGVLDTTGAQLHETHWVRFAFFISLSAPVIGAWIYALRRYKQSQPSVDAEDQAWLAGLAQSLMIRGGAVVLLAGAAWMWTLPEKMSFFATSPWVVISAAALILTVVLPSLLGRRLDSSWAYGVFGMGVVALIVVAAAREILRYQVLFGIHGYDALDYKINMDWYSTLTFFLTFVSIGGVTLAYLIAIAWRAGQTEGVYTPGPAIQRLGRLSVGLLIFWIVHYFVVGFWVWMA